MATKIPRAQVTLDEITNRAVRRLSSVSGQSVSKVIGGLLTECVEPMDRLSDILERAKNTEGELPKGAKQAVDIAANNLERLEREALDTMQMISSSFMPQDAPSMPHIDPPPLTGGSTLHSEATKTIEKAIRSNKNDGGLA